MVKSFCDKIGRKIGVNRSLIRSMHAQRYPPSHPSSEKVPPNGTDCYTH